MSTDKSIVEFLCRDENLSLAIEVAEAIDAVDERVELRFLELMYTGVAQRFNASSLGRDWKLKKGVDQASKTCRYASVYIIPCRSDAPHFLLYPLVVCRESSDFCLYYGLERGGRSGEEPTRFPTDERTPLVAFLEDREFERSKWNLGFKSIASFMNRKELLLTLHQRADELSAAAVNDFWAFFEATVDMVVATNASVDRSVKWK